LIGIDDGEHQELNAWIQEEPAAVALRVESAIKFRSQVPDAFDQLTKAAFLVRLVEFRDCGWQNIVGQMIDELMTGIEAFPAQRAAWHNDAAATLRFIHERP
jgi:hypothetical protein